LNKYNIDIIMLFVERWLAGRVLKASLVHQKGEI